MLQLTCTAAQTAPGGEPARGDCCASQPRRTAAEARLLAGSLRAARCLFLAGLLPVGAADARPLRSSDYPKLRSVLRIALAPDGSRLAYAGERYDRPGRPYRQLWVMSLLDGKCVRVGSDADRAGEASWSPDGRWIAFLGLQGGRSGLHVVRPDGTGLRFLAETVKTNSPLTFEGRSVTWSPDSRRIAFVSSVPGPETDAVSGDPLVFTRYLYKPHADEWATRLNDNRRRQIFVLDLEGGEPRALTSGPYEHHSMDWSPNGSEIVCVSSREPDPDLFYNPDLFAVRLADGSIRRLTATEGAEYQPRWSPDGRRLVFLGTRRGLTDLETAMEDPHVWIANADGGNRAELVELDRRQAEASFSPSGTHVYFTAQVRGHVRLYRAPAAGGAPELMVQEPGRVGAVSVSSGAVAFTFTGLADLAQAYVLRPPESPRRLTDLNANVLNDVDFAPVETFTFVSADFKHEVEGFLTRPLGQTSDSRHPMIVMIHGGPHSPQGPVLNLRSQIYAGLGWATLQVNFRGSTGYGQAFADAIFRDQNGQEAMDVLYGVSAALRRNPWIDRERVGVEGASYGGQLTCWLIAQTPMFKAAVAIAPVTNNISYNYTTYYNQYEEMEWGMRPHQADLMDVLWERSALKHVAKVKTPTMLVHGENDADVPVTESEQFYVALRDVGVETVMVRYRREGHVLREPDHVVDLIDRSMGWYERHFESPPRPQVPR